MTIYLWGGSGAVGRFVLPLLARAGGAVVAFSRHPNVASAPPFETPHVAWQCADLRSQDLRVDAQDEAILVCAGPLDQFVAFLARIALPAGSRVLALSSLSARWKADSANIADARLAARLLDSEAQLLSTCRQRNVAVCILRCGLIYGAGVDRTLTPLRRIAARWRVLPWPGGAQGIRQPVHAADIANALIHAVLAEAPMQGLFELPGPEPLTWPAMLRRTLESLDEPAKLLLVPDFALDRLLRALVRLGEPWASRLSMLQRIYQDQVCPTDDWRQFGLAPRAFKPTKSDFEANVGSVKSKA